MVVLLWRLEVVDAELVVILWCWVNGDFMVVSWWNELVVKLGCLPDGYGEMAVIS